MAFFNILLKKQIKDRGKWIITIGLFLVCTLNVYVLNEIFENTKNEYRTTTYSNLMTTITLLGTTKPAINSYFSYDPNKNIVHIRKSISEDTIFYLKEKIDDELFACKGSYDIRDTNVWSLDYLGELWQDTSKGNKFIAPYSFTLIDKNKETLEQHEYNIDQLAIWRFRFQIPLGFIEQHQLHVEFIYPFQQFWSEVWDKIITIVALFLMIVIAMVSQFFQLQDEKRLREIRKKFTNAMVHNLRTPITYFRLQLANISMQNVLPTKQQTALTKCEDKADQLLEDVNSILSVAVSAYGLVATIKPCDLSEITNELKEKYQIHHIEKEIYISTDNQINDPVNMDSLLIKSALENIIGNAIKYSGADTRIHIKSYSENKKIVISITDNGFGIPKDEQAYIFDENYRGEKHKTKGKGYGLGLFYVKATILAHKGDINVDSDGENGTTFMIKIPQ